MRNFQNPTPDAPERKPGRVPADHHRPEAMPDEVASQLLFPFFGEHPADELVLIRPRPEPGAPVVDEDVAQDHAEVAGRERRPIRRHPLRRERAAHEQHEILADGHAKALRREENQNRGVAEAKQKLRDRVLHQTSVVDETETKSAARGPVL